jgi:hypothetical protein
MVINMGKPKKLGEKPAPVPVVRHECYEISRNLIKGSPLRSQRLHMSYSSASIAYIIRSLLICSEIICYWTHFQLLMKLLPN